MKDIRQIKTDIINIVPGSNDTVSRPSKIVRVIYKDGSEKKYNIENRHELEEFTNVAGAKLWYKNGSLKGSKASILTALFG